jgi:hypothetical protein
MLALRQAAVSFVFLALLVACGGRPADVASRSDARSTPAAETAVNPDQSSTGAQTGSTTELFACSDRLSGGGSSQAAHLTQVRVGHHDGFDRMTFQFDGKSGLPRYALVPQSSAAFVRDPSGQALSLEGAAGLRVIFQGATGVDLGAAPPRPTYTGSQDVKAGLTFVRELAQVGDFERVLSWGAGLSAPACLRLTELANPARLAIDVRSAPPVTAAEIRAVAQRVFPGEYPTGCNPQDRAACPITDRLAARLGELSVPQADRPGPPILFCRCQNPASRAMDIEATTTPAGGTAHVTLYPDVSPIRLDLLMVRQGGRVLVDDTQCTGRGPSTSIYEQLVACSV